MVDITWEDVENHVDKGDLKEWLKEERTKDKARQLVEADTPQTDCPYDEDDKCFGCGEDTKCVVFDTPQTDCGWGEPNE